MDALQQQLMTVHVVHGYLLGEFFFFGRYLFEELDHRVLIKLLEETKDL